MSHKETDNDQIWPTSHGLFVLGLNLGLCMLRSHSTTKLPQPHSLPNLKENISLESSHVML